MTRKFILSLITAALAFQLQAVTIENTAGYLYSKVTDTGITSLTVTGTMNANDFYFIADSLNSLITVDLSGVEVVASNTAKVRYMQREFAAGELPAGAFSGKGITGVVLPAELTLIGDAAFAGCVSLIDLTLPETVTGIGEYAFAGCTSLTGITLPASVERVGTGAFMRCTQLESLTVAPDSRLSNIGEGALMDCPALATVSLGAALETIGERALAGSGVGNLDLTASKSLTSIDAWALTGSQFTSAKLPASLTTLGEGAFLYATRLEDVSMGSHLAGLNDYALSGTALTTSPNMPSVSSIGDYAMYNVSTLSVVELPSTLTWMGARSMAGMIGMTELKSNATDVPALGENVWDGINQSVIPLTVPASAKDNYAAAEQWKEFLFNSSWLKGDVNLDGEVNIGDVNTVLFVILRGAADEGMKQRADVNEDGEINIGDVNALISIILNADKSVAMIDTDDQLRLDNLDIQPGEERTITVKLDNAADYSALQCDIMLPQGLTLVNAAVRSRKIETSEITASTSRAMAYSMERQRFDDAGVLTLTVRADASLALEGDIVIDNVVIADNDNVAWHAAATVARVSNSTGIEDLTATADKIWLEGRTLCIQTGIEGNAQLAAVNGTNRSLTLAAGVNRQPLEPGFYVVTLNGKSHKIAVK